MQTRTENFVKYKMFVSQQPSCFMNDYVRTSDTFSGFAFCNSALFMDSLSLFLNGLTLKRADPDDRPEIKLNYILLYFETFKEKINKFSALRTG